MKLVKLHNQPYLFLVLLAVAMPFTFSVWNVQLNNAVVELANFTGKEIGILQSIREIPGLLAISAILFLLFILEQRFAVLALVLLSAGVALTGQFTSVLGFYLTTLLMSFGFHYLETTRDSLALQWLPKKTAPAQLGKLLAVTSYSSLGAYGMVWLLQQLSLSYELIYLVAGAIGLCLAGYLWLKFPVFQQSAQQHKKLIFRRKYWLFYLLTFMSGARRQIFVVFAAFMMVEKFHYSVSDITLLFIINHLVSIWLAPKIGKMVQHFGERFTLSLEYIGLIIVFTGYAWVESSEIAAMLYVVDHIFFAMAIALKTYMQKVVDEQDIAATAAMNFTINHIAAVFLPVILGIVWLTSPEWVFYIGSVLALLSFMLVQLIPYTLRQVTPMAQQVVNAEG
ncbi:MFS transporter [Zooshikella marina]|uniref:MFS transporter n=1 Tax=Zooshikella ganghwensis TaxID=202772 RepID=UPI001BAFB7B9|nr:MFS transporter [Zooshikella ganghwensis]MBU2708413.1 MFS transporter [Zooshikella ganghwensis]